jgi:hypothetical protein
MQLFSIKENRAMSEFASKIEVANDVEQVLKCARPGCLREALIFVRHNADGKVPAGVKAFCKTCAFREMDKGARYFGLAFSVKTTETVEHKAPEITEVPTTKTTDTLGEPYQQVLLALTHPR